MPVRNAAQSETASSSLLPGIEALFAAIMFCQRLDAGVRDQPRLHVVAEQLAAIGAVLLQEVELVAGAAGLAEVAGAIDVRRHLVGDELGDLGIFLPGLGRAERRVELRLIGLHHLRILEDVLAVVEGEHVAVVEEAPDLALVGRQRLVERVVVLKVRHVHVFGDVVVERRDHAAVGERRRPGRRDVEDVIGAGAGDVLGDRLGILVRIGQFDDVRLDAGELLPHRPGEIARVERLQAGLVGHVQGDAGILLGGLRGAEGGAVRRPFRRRLHAPAPAPGRAARPDPPVPASAGRWPIPSCLPAAAPKRRACRSSGRSG